MYMVLDVGAIEDDVEEGLDENNIGALSLKTKTTDWGCFPSGKRRTSSPRVEV